MKNHWTEIYKKKHNHIWTIEFGRNAIFELKPRPVTLRDSSYVIGQLGQNRGKVAVVFANAMNNVNDDELLDFLSSVLGYGMGKYYGVLRRYNHIMSQREVDFFELTGLSYHDLLEESNDMTFIFNFQHVRHVVV